MNSQFINDLKNSKFYKLLFLQYEVIAIFIVGSRVMEITDNHSDYDILVWTTNSPNLENSPFYLTYNGTKVHWYFRNIHDFIVTSNAKNRLMELIGNVNYCFLTDELLIYKNEELSKYINFLEENKKEIMKLSVINFMKNYTKIPKIIKDGTILEEEYSKFLYHICCFNYAYFERVFDKDFLSAIKRIRYQPTTKEQRTKCYELINELYNEVKDKDITDSINNIKEKINAL